jgi:ferredoxin
MAYVVREPCHDCKYTDCVVVCPMECFYEDGSMLYIDADDCIDCNGCVPECPVAAIFPETEVPAQWAHYIALNAERARAIKASGAGSLREKQVPKQGAGCKK